MTSSSKTLVYPYPVVILSGNPADGFKVFGPFLNHEEVTEYTEDKLKNEEWWSLSIEDPEL